MPNITISKIKLRRGTNTQRQTMVFDQGELVSTTDTNRVYIGDGVTSGGVSIDSRILTPITQYTTLSTIIAEQGDIINVNNIFYQLTGYDYSVIANWGNVGAKLDPSILQYDGSNNITLIPNSVDTSYLKTSTLGGSLSVISGVLQDTFQPKSLTLSGGKLSIIPSSIDEREISTTALSSGIKGGSGSKIMLDVDSTQFNFSGNTLQLANSGVNEFNISSTSLSSGLTGGSGSKLKLNVNPSQFYFFGNTLTLSSLPASMFGAGLTYNALKTPSLSTVLANVDNTTIKNTNGTIGLVSYPWLSGSTELSKVTTDVYGRPTVTNAIYGTLSGNSSLSPSVSATALSSIFNGYPAQSLSGSLPGVALTHFTAISANGSVITLSSAGFITFEGNSITRNGDTVGRFAIPIFAY